MKNSKRVLISVLVLVSLLALTVAIAAAQGTQLQTVSTPLEKAVMGVGGEEALQSLMSLSIESGGIRWLHDEGFTVGGHDMIGPYGMTTNYDVAGDNLRVDNVFGSGDSARELSEIIVGDVGILDGRNSNFGPPAVSPMLSDRWAAIRKHQRLLNPHLILLDVWANPDMASDGGEVLHEGSVYHLLVVEDEVAPITLYINAGTGRVAKLTTAESDALRRDVPLEVFYYSWQPVGENLFFPAELYVAYDGDIVHKEIRTAIGINAELSGDLFVIPDDVTLEFNEALAARGATLHQYLQTFAARGFPRDGQQTNVQATELAPGVYHLTGGSHHSLAVEQENGVIIVEAPLDEVRSQAVMDWVAENIPDKAITHAVSSHHHVDHSAGLRQYVAMGTTAVMHESAEAYFADIFLSDSAIVPDTLEENPVAATIATVPADGVFTVEDGLNTLEVYPIANGHAQDMVITHIPEAGVVFVVDLYNPNPAAGNLPPGGQLLGDRIAELGLTVSTIAGGHGGTIDFATFDGLHSGQ